MKKILILFVLVFGLMSFGKINFESTQIQTCCTATLLVNGVPIESATACINGIGPETSALACSAARGALKEKLQISQ